MSEQKMPIYEYMCDNCYYEFEKIHKTSDDGLKTCPQCQQNSLRKLVSSAGFRLKGGGWYETDFKKDGQKNLFGTKSEPKSEEKTDTKPAPQEIPS